MHKPLGDLDRLEAVRRSERLRFLEGWCAGMDRRPSRRLVQRIEAKAAVSQDFREALNIDGYADGRV